MYEPSGADTACMACEKMMDNRDDGGDADRHHQRQVAARDHDGRRRLTAITGDKWPRVIMVCRAP
jgi:hypothetical protein